MEKRIKNQFESKGNEIAVNIELDKLRAVEVDILETVKKVCEDNNLKYSLAYGTLIGALRHKGFIPWDDDIDIIMPRNDYERLISIWNSLPIAEEYILQNKYTNEDFTQNFTKIRKNNTTFIQSEEEFLVEYHTGVFLDIFPGDRVASGFLRKAQYFACALNLLTARGFLSGNKGITGLIERTILALPHKVQLSIFRATDCFIQRWNDDTSKPLFFPSTICDAQKEYPANLFDRMTRVEFEGHQFAAVRCMDDMLKIDYGDYMKLPPEKDRVLKHHPLKIDLYHNRDEK